MYTETAIPVGELLVRGSCNEGIDEMPIDLITVRYANRVPSSRQDKLTDHAYVESYINGVHGSYRSETLVTFQNHFFSNHPPTPQILDSSMQFVPSKFLRYMSFK
jgi:hypothetical protein